MFQMNVIVDTCYIVKRSFGCYKYELYVESLRWSMTWVKVFGSFVLVGILSMGWFSCPVWRGDTFWIKSFVGLIDHVPFTVKYVYGLFSVMKHEVCCIMGFLDLKKVKTSQKLRDYWHSWQRSTVSLCQITIVRRPFRLWNLSSHICSNFRTTRWWFSFWVVYGCVETWFRLCTHAKWTSYCIGFRTIKGTWGELSDAWYGAYSYCICT